MTEREKMLSGQLYDCGDPELLNQWHDAKDLVRDYNALDSRNAAEKKAILKQLLGASEKICGLHRLSLWIMGTISISVIIVRSI